jgi:ATP-binding protein involved in chromosome partitioning
MKDKIIELIGSVQDKDFKRPLRDLGVQIDVDVQGSKINAKLKLVPPVESIKCSLGLEIEKTVKAAYPECHIEVEIDSLAIQNRASNQLSGVKNLIAVASGKGGVGKSTVAANLAVALARTGAKVGILDADVYGPSQPIMFGLSGEQMEAFETEDGKVLAEPRESLGIKVVSMGFAMQKEDAAIVRGPMLSSFFSMLFEQVYWGELDYLIFDLPPGTGDIQLTMTQKIPLTGAVIVTTPQEISLADVRRSIAMFNKVNVDILGVVENMSYFVPPDMPDKKYYIFGEGGGKRIAQEFGVDLLGEAPLSANIREGGDSGKPVVEFDSESDQAKAFINIADNLIAKVRKANKASMGSAMKISL